MKTKYIITTILIASFLLSSYGRFTDVQARPKRGHRNHSTAPIAPVEIPIEEPVTESVEHPIVSPDFDWKMDRELNITVQIDMPTFPLFGNMVSIRIPNTSFNDAHGLTNSLGQFTTIITIPNYHDHIIVKLTKLMGFQTYEKSVSLTSSSLVFVGF